MHSYHKFTLEEQLNKKIPVKMYQNNGGTTEKLLFKVNKQVNKKANKKAMPQYQYHKFQSYLVIKN